MYMCVIRSSRYNRLRDQLLLVLNRLIQHFVGVTLNPQAWQAHPAHGPADAQAVGGLSMFWQQWQLLRLRQPLLYPSVLP